MNEIQVGYLLRSSIAGFVAGCRVARFETHPPDFGCLVRASLGTDAQVYGLIYNINIDDDGLVRQLVTAEEVDEATIADNRENRTVPVEISILAIGYRQAGCIYHLLPPRPPLSLDMIYLCGADELRQFTSTGRFGYFRHVLRAADLPISELLAAHVQQASHVHRQAGDLGWTSRATQELITLLRDDYPALMSVLGALSEIFESQS
jgi:hypothetical protein